MATLVRHDPIWTLLSLVWASRGPAAFATIDDLARLVVSAERELGTRLEPSLVLERWLRMGGFPPLAELEEEGGR